MAVVAALDAVLMLRLGRMRPGWPRAASAVLGTALVIALANWAIVSGQMGKPMGLLPWESMFYLGPDRSEEHTSELQSLMRISYVVVCLKKKYRKVRNRQHIKYSEENPYRYQSLK